MTEVLFGTCDDSFSPDLVEWQEPNHQTPYKERPMNRFFLASIATTLVALTAGLSLPRQQDDDKPVQDPASVMRRDYMRTKLMFTQNIFEGLTLGDFEAIKIAADEVERITEGGQWVAIDTEEYRKLTTEFKSTITRLQQAAKDGNIEATALRYYQLSTSCIDCHKHLRKANYDF